MQYLCSLKVLAEQVARAAPDIIRMQIRKHGHPKRWFRRHIAKADIDVITLDESIDKEQLPLVEIDQVIVISFKVFSFFKITQIVVFRPYYYLLNFNKENGPQKMRYLRCLKP